MIGLVALVGAYVSTGQIIPGIFLMSTFVVIPVRNCILYCYPRCLSNQAIFFGFFKLFIF